MPNEERSKLPYRRNREGYFLCRDKRIIALNTGKGYLEFPGGGIDNNEEPKKALLREAFEEAGIIVEGELEEVNILHFLWDSQWAKTEKQRKRYLNFKGEEIHFLLAK